MNLEEFQVWWKEKSDTRTVDITLSERDGDDNSHAWVYDYDLMVGQIVTSVSEIDLEARYKEELEQKIKQLKDIGG